MGVVNVNLVLSNKLYIEVKYENTYFFGNLSVYKTFYWPVNKFYSK